MHGVQRGRDTYLDAMPDIPVDQSAPVTVLSGQVSRVSHSLPASRLPLCRLTERLARGPAGYQVELLLG
jgi:hypothetical protein